MTDGVIFRREQRAVELGFIYFADSELHYFYSWLRLTDVTGFQSDAWLRSHVVEGLGLIS